MDGQIGQLQKILREETGIFDKIYSLERSKTGAIIEQNGALLEKLSRAQEGLLSDIMALEPVRMKRVDEFKRARHIRHQGISISDIAQHIETPEAEQLRVIGRSLKDSMLKLQRLQETNQTLINDNMEYYNILLTGLRRSGPLDTGYRRDGKEAENLKSSILFNKTA